jgi:polyisoprenoid-binding protein YceI
VRYAPSFVSLVAAGLLPLGLASAQQPFGTAARDTAPDREALADTAPRIPRSRIAPAGDFGGADSVVYHFLPASRLDVHTGKAGLFGFAGHTHVIRARGFAGRVVYYPKSPAASHVEISVPTARLEVLTPDDTAEIRKVTESMRTEVLEVSRYPEMKLASRSVAVTGDGIHLTAALTMHGETRELPLDLVVELGPDTVHAQTRFAVKQTDFGIKPFSGGPGGTVKVADRVGFEIDAIGAREGPRDSPRDAEHGQ